MLRGKESKKVERDTTTNMKTNIYRMEMEMEREWESDRDRALASVWSTRPRQLTPGLVSKLREGHAAGNKDLSGETLLWFPPHSSLPPRLQSSGFCVSPFSETCKWLWLCRTWDSHLNLFFRPAYNDVHSRCSQPPPETLHGWGKQTREWKYQWLCGKNVFLSKLHRKFRTDLLFWNGSTSGDGQLGFSNGERFK